MRFDVGSRIGLGRQIRLTEPLSHGTTSYSFKAHDDELDRPVFCKILREEYPTESNYLELLQFAKNLSALNVPGLPKLFDIGEVDGIIYQIWEWIDGITLHDLAIKQDRAKPLPTVFTHYLLTQCLTALHHLHGHGIIHGDLSPHNIMVSSTLGRIWLVDLAPVKMAEGSVIATRAWAAPEVLEGGAIGPWSDLYSLGMVVTEFASRTNLEEPECLRLLTQHNPSDRPSSAEAVLMLLSLSSEGRSGAPQASPSPSPRAPSPEPPSPPSTQRSSISLGGLVGAAAAPVLFPFRGIAAGISGLSMFFGSAKKKLRPSAVPSPPSDKQLGRAPDNWSDRTGISNVPIRTSSMAEPSEADFIVMGPSLVSRERSFPLELWVGPSNHVTELKQRASDRGRLVERGARSLISLPNAVTITAVMTLPGFEVVNPTEQIFWDGSIRNSAFIVTVPPNMVPGRYAGIVKLVVDALPLGTISFNIELAENPDLPDQPNAQLSDPLRRFRTAFASYSRRNTAEVFKRVQAIRAGEIDVFVDIANLRGGDRWQKVLMQEIAARDVFYLFWSREAARSEWVEKEWREALARRGLDFICPIPLEDPRLAEPPKELRELHFNDWCLAIIRGEQALDAER